MGHCPVLPIKLGLFVLGREGWLPWPAVEGQTNCTNPSLCPILSFPTRARAVVEAAKQGAGVVIPVDTNNPSAGGLYAVGPSPLLEDDGTPWPTEFERINMPENTFLQELYKD